jgi:hypothetical protein
MKVGDRYWLRFDHTTVVEISMVYAPNKYPPVGEQQIEWWHVGGPHTGLGPFQGYLSHFIRYYEEVSE